MNKSAGTLWVVATPIGNFDDLSKRALDTLSSVDWIAAEDTRHSGVLLNHFGLKRPLISCHDHNEGERAKQLVDKLLSGESGAIISDAGTPLISDPGYRLVSAVRESGISVKVIPGPSSVIAALSIAGLPTDQFQFLGFLPAKSKTRRDVLEAVSLQSQTTVLFESVHRLKETAALLDEVLSSETKVFLARELTKQFEETALLSAGEVSEWIAEDEFRLRGEYVVIISPASKQGSDEAVSSVDTDKLINALLDEGVGTKSIASALSASLGLNKKKVYQHVLTLIDSNESD